jgi:peptide/nickel transport system permease protein
MASYLLNRFVRLVSVVLAVSFATFVLINNLPGSPVNAILGVGGTAAQRAQIAAELGLNHPVLFRYFYWLGHALQGNLGNSYVSNQSVTSTVAQHLPLTIELMLEAEFLSLLIAVPVALFCALRANGWFDKSWSFITLAFLALPAFVLAPLLRDLFVVKWHLFPATGYVQWFQWGNPQSPTIIATPTSIFLPSLILAIGQVAIFFRVLRGDLLTTLRTQFITLARSKGLTTRRILLTHALRPSSFTLLTLLGLSIGGLLAGALVVENAFALPGMGLLIVDSIEKRDYLMVQGIVVLTSAGFVLVNFLTDFFYGVLDPRVRRGTLVT